MLIDIHRMRAMIYCPMSFDDFCFSLKSLTFLDNGNEEPITYRWSNKKQRGHSPRAVFLPLKCQIQQAHHPVFLTILQMPCR